MWTIPTRSFTYTPNELIRRCFLRRQDERLQPAFRGLRNALSWVSSNLRILLANGSDWRQCRKARGPRLRPRALIEPRHESIHIDGCGRRDLL